MSSTIIGDPIKGLPPEATQPSRLAGRVIVSKDAQAHEKPDYERPALQRMREKWELPDTLLGGTEAMRKAREKVLVREQDETDDEYDRRLSRTVLTNYYGNTIDTHSGMPFANPITFDPPLPEPLQYLEHDADGEGRSITVLARDLLREGLHRGMTHLLVDLPPNRGESSHADTLRRRPKLLHIQPGDVLSVLDQPGKDGEDVVTYVRLSQARTREQGAFGEESYRVILEIDANAHSAVTWEPQKDGSWNPTEEVAYTPPAIPLFTFYAKQVGDFEAEPAYRYLAELNRTHFQSDADQRHALTYGRRATLARTGWKDGLHPGDAGSAAKSQAAKKKKAVLGYGRSLDSANDAAKAYLVETNGAPLAAGEADLKGLEQRMERFGAQQISQAGGITATSRKLDNDRDTCNLQAWCTRLENVILHALRAAAELKGVKLPAGQRVKVDRSFSSQGPTDDDIPHVFEAFAQGIIDAETALAELKVRGVTATVDDVKAVVRAAQEAKENAVVASMDRMAQRMVSERQPPTGKRATEEPDEIGEPAAAGAGAA